MELARLQTPWDVPCTNDAFFRALSSHASRWVPTLEVGGLDLRRSLDVAIENHAPWLSHPCVNALTLPTAEHRTGRDFLLVWWLALHTEGATGTVHLETPAWAWSSDGGFAVATGTHDLGALLSKAQGARRTPNPIDLDPWSDSVGVCLDAPLEEEPIRPTTPPHWDAGRLAEHVVAICRAMWLLQSALPACHAWTREVTKVIALLPQLPTVTRNWCRQDVPGLIYMTIPHDVLEILDTIVHESAHRYFFRIESEHPVVAEEDPAVHCSPLRPDPRPLRGILLACHALVYMGALYRDVRGLLTAADNVAAQRLERIQTQYFHSLETIYRASKTLTSRGRELLAQIEQVAAHAFS